MKVSDIVEVCEKKIYYEIINPHFRKQSSPMIIFLHEGLGSVRQWKDFPEYIGMKLNYPVLVYDRYGYGKSEELSEPRTKDYLKEEGTLFLPELLEKLEITERLILFGHSDGGSIALLFASKFPEKVIGLITEADHVFSEDLTLTGIKNIVKEYESGTVNRSLRYYHRFKTDAMFYGWSNVWLSEQNKDWTIEECLSSITCPVLAIQGKDDNLSSETQLLLKKKKIRGQVEILFIDNCGHVPHFQAENLVKENVISFICKCMTIMN